MFKNRAGNCTQVNNDHEPTVEQIGTDLILLNQYNDRITANDEEIKLNGTYLVKIYEQEHFSLEVSGAKPLPVIPSPSYSLKG